jgi:hypothetical protein
LVEGLDRSSKLPQRIVLDPAHLGRCDAELLGDGRTAPLARAVEAESELDRVALEPGEPCQQGVDPERAQLFP